MSGRNPHEAHRAATPLELLYDLVFVVAFSVAGAEFAHTIAAGHWTTGLAAFLFCIFAVVWAWVNFVWFASAYDTDDWVYRLLAMVQMCGLALLALGIPAIFGSFEEGGTLHNEVLVTGYVIMRVALLAQFLRAASRDRARRGRLLAYVGAWGLAQVGWVGLIFLHVTVDHAILVALPLYVLEIAVPWIAERRGGLPWHAHHIAERYSLLVIITLGEGVVGTVAALSTLVSRGWNLDTVMLLVAGMGVTFGMWWTYFLLPCGQVLHVRRHKAVIFSHLHIPLYMAIVAVGSGLHVVAYLLDREHAGFDVQITAVGTVVAVAVPVAIYLMLVFTLYAYLLRTSNRHDLFHGVLLVAVMAVLAAGVAIVVAGGSVMLGILVVAFAPGLMCLAYELWGHRHLDEELAVLAAEQTAALHPDLAR